MNEQQFLDKIEEMRKDGRCNTSPDSAKRYAAELRAGSDLSQTVAEEEIGICQPGQGILDLETPEQLEKLDLWQGVTQLSDRERAAIKLFLKMHGITPMSKKSALQTELAQEEAKEAERLTNRVTASTVRREEPPLSLYGLLVALRQSTKNRRSSEGEPTYTLLMRALLLNDNYYWSSDSTERHLRRWGGNYYEYAQVILANTHNEQRRELVKKKMLEALQEMEDESVGPELRLDVARACVSLEQDMEQWKLTQENPEEEWGCYEGSEAQLVLQQLASMHKGTISHIYKIISDEDLAELVVKLFSLAIDASEGRFPPAPDPEERLAKLSPAEQALVAVVTCGLPMKRKHWLMEDIQPMMMNILLAGVLVPEQGVGRYDKLVLAKGIHVARMKKTADVFLQGERTFRSEKIIWDNTEVSLELSEAINDGAFQGKDRSAVWKLFRELLKKNGPEDVKDGAGWALTEQLELILEQVRGNEELSVLSFLVRCHWRRIDAGNDMVAIESLDKLLFWMERYPAEMEKIWDHILPGSTLQKKAESLCRTGGSLIHAQLHSNCAGRCLSRAWNRLYQKDFWASSAVRQAEQALKQLRVLHSPMLAAQAAGIKAIGYALLGDRVCCEEALEEANQWNENNNFNPFLENMMNGDLDGIHEVCEKQLQQWEGKPPLDPRFYGWFMADRSYDMDQVREIVMRALDCDKLTESSLLLCLQVWDRIPLNSRIVGWERLAEKMMGIDLMYQNHPETDADQICNCLINSDVIDCGTLGMDIAKEIRSLIKEMKGKDR